MTKYKQVKVNFAIDDYDKLSQIASFEEKTIAQLIRSRFDFEIENTPSRREIVVYKKADPRLLYELNRVGNNINQIAKKLNSNHMFEKRVLLKIYEEVMKIK